MSTPPLGWIEPANRTQKQHDAHARAVAAMPRFTLPVPQLAKGESVKLYDAWSKPEVVADVGFVFSRFHQLTGSCVGAGAGNGEFSLIATQRLISDAPTKAFLPFWPFNYGRSRLYMGDHGQGEGSLGSTLFKSLVEDGTIASTEQGLPAFKDNDGLILSESLEMKWSDGDSPTVTAYLPAAKGHVVQAASDISGDIGALRAGIVNGYPATFACNNYIGNASVKGSGASACVMGRWDGSGGHQQCLAPDTNISLLNGTEATVKELADIGKPCWIYSYDHATGKVIPKEAAARMTRKSVPEGMVRVTLDNGEALTTTLDHRFLLRNGEWREAQHLRPDDSLMPLYRRISTTKDSKRHPGYEMLLDPGSGEWRFTHHRVDECFPGRSLRFVDGELVKAPLPDEALPVVHHVNFDKRDNCPDNLSRMVNKEHWKYHSHIADGVWDRMDDDYREERREQAKATMHRLHADPEFKKKLRAGQKKASRTRESDPVFQEKRAEGSRKSTARLKQEPDYVARKRATLAKIKQEPGYKTRQAAAAAAIGRRPKVIQARLEGRKKWLAENKEQFSELIKARSTRSEYKQKQSVSQKNSWTDPVIRERRRAAIKASWARRKAAVAAPVNHKVVSVLFLPGETGPTYCLYVEGTHNFAVSAGVFVHNSVHAFWEHPDFGPLYYVLNNWPGSTYPRDPAGGPVCGCWVAEANVQAAMRLDAEVFLLSHLAWFPAQPTVLDYFA